MPAREEEQLMLWLLRFYSLLRSIEITCLLLCRVKA